MVKLKSNGGSTQPTPSQMSGGSSQKQTEAEVRAQLAAAELRFSGIADKAHFWSRLTKSEVLIYDFLLRNIDIAPFKEP